MSYFEWLKNLSHVRFGRLNKKWEERSKHDLLSLLQDSAKIDLAVRLPPARHADHSAPPPRVVPRGAASRTLASLTPRPRPRVQTHTQEYQRILAGPSERDIVYSGLEETMTNAVNELVRWPALTAAAAGELTRGRCS